MQRRVLSHSDWEQSCRYEQAEPAVPGGASRGPEHGSSYLHQSNESWSPRKQSMGREESGRKWEVQSGLPAMTLHWGRTCKCYSRGPLAPQMPFPGGVKRVQRGGNRFIPLPVGPKARFGQSLGKGQGIGVSCAARMQASWGSGVRFSLLGYGERGEEALCRVVFLRTLAGQCGYGAFPEHGCHW